MAQMSAELSRLLDEASMLPLEEQEVLANSLLAHLVDNIDESVQAAWDVEIKRRVEEIKSGRAKTIPLEEARRRMTARIRDAAR